MYLSLKAQLEIYHPFFTFVACGICHDGLGDPPQDLEPENAGVGSGAEPDINIGVLTQAERATRTHGQRFRLCPQ